MNWKLLESIMMRVIPLLKPTIYGVQAVAQEAATGASKKDMAMTALGFGLADAQAIDPQHKETFDAAANITAGLIDGVVAVAHQSGNFNKAAAAAELANEAVPAIAQFGKTLVAPPELHPTAIIATGAAGTPAT